MLARFREERASAPDAALAELLARTTAGAGRAVLVSGLAVAIALAGLAVFADRLLAAMALGGVLAVALATLTGLTLTPALIAVAHRRIPPARERGPGVLARLAAFAQRFPVPVAVAVAAALVALSVPAFGLDVANADATSLPADSEARRVYEIAQRDFSRASVDPMVVLIDAPPLADGSFPVSFRSLTRDITEGGPMTGLPAGLAGLELDPAGPDAGERAQELVRAIRDLDPRLRVGGPAAELVDAKDSTAERLPLALAVIVIPTALLLFALTRSVLIPIKALVMNALTLGATLGVLTLVFDGPLDITTPLLLFMLIFGLSMDYEVFLLSRIKEEHDRGETNPVLQGITASGPVVTTAAIAIGVVFLGFALGTLAEVREIGVGMAIAVFLDVTVVRGLLLPSTMAILGRWNWWPGAHRP
jgi:RND superfamily putative drug exporter